MIGTCNNSGARDFSSRSEDGNDEAQTVQRVDEGLAAGRLASSEAKVKEMLAEPDRQERERTRDERTSSVAPERAPSRSPELTR